MQRVTASDWKLTTRLTAKVNERLKKQLAVRKTTKNDNKQRSNKWELVNIVSDCVKTKEKRPDSTFKTDVAQQSFHHFC